MKVFEIVLRVVTILLTLLVILACLGWVRRFSEYEENGIDCMPPLVGDMEELCKEAERRGWKVFY